MSKMMVKVGDEWVAMEGLKGDTGPLPADESIPDTALVTDGAKTNTAYLMRNRLTKDAEGELISVEDSYAVPPVSLSADGKSTQVTTTGKNLLNPNVAVNANGWLRRRLSANGYGTVQSSGGTICNIFLVPLEDGQSLTYSRGSILKPGFHFMWTTDETLEIGSVANNINTLTNYATRVFTNNTGGLVYAGVAASVNSSMFDEPRYLEMAKVQLEYATAFTSYEPYSGGVASPSPNWAQEIESVNDPTIYIFGKNLVSAIEQGSFNTYNDTVASTTVCRLPKSVSLEALVGKTLTCTGAVSGGTFEWNLVYLVDRGRYSYRHNSGVSLPIPANAHDLVLVFGTSEDIAVTPSDFSNVQLEIGSASTDYEPYSGDIASILLEEPLRSLPDGTKDELHLTYIRPSTREGWAYYRCEKIKRINITILDGSESYGPEGGRFYVRQNNMKRLDNYSQSLICNFLKAYPKQSYIGGVVTFVSGISGYYHATSYAGQNWFYVAIEKGMTASDTKQWVSEHPITIQYPLATPETIDLGIFELPTMQSGTTNLWSDPSTNLSVTYERDRNIVITNLKAAVADLATS